MMRKPLLGTGFSRSCKSTTIAGQERAQQHGQAGRWVDSAPGQSGAGGEHGGTSPAVRVQQPERHAGSNMSLLQLAALLTACSFLALKRARFSSSTCLRYSGFCRYLLTSLRRSTTSCSRARGQRAVKLRLQERQQQQMSSLSSAARNGSGLAAATSDARSPSAPSAMSWCGGGQAPPAASGTAPPSPPPSRSPPRSSCQSQTGHLPWSLRPGACNTAGRNGGGGRRRRAASWGALQQGGQPKHAADAAATQARAPGHHSPPPDHRSGGKGVALR